MLKLYLQVSFFLFLRCICLSLLSLSLCHVRQLSLVAVSGGCSLVAVGWLLLLLSTGSRRTGSAAVALRL